MRSPTGPVRPRPRQLLTLPLLLLTPLLADAAPRYRKPTEVKVKVTRTHHTAVKPAADAAPRARAAPAPQLHAETFRRQLRAKVSILTDRAIKILMRLIRATGNDDPEKPDYLFRLAEHYRDKKVDAMFKARELDEPIYRARTEGAKRRLQARQRAYARQERGWLLKAVRTYLDVAKIEAFASYKRMDAVLFNLADLLNQENKRAQARVFFRRLIRSHPQSPYVPDAYLSFAEFYFKEGQVEPALRLYQKVGKYPDSPLYGFALYKQGWCWLNLKEPRRALEVFVRVIRHRPTGAAARRRQLRISLVREARKDAVRAYSHVGTPERAWDFFSRIGGEHAQRMLEQLATLYFDQGKFLPSIQLHRKLMALQPESDRLCSWQYAVLRATLAGKDKRQQVVEARRLAAVHGALTKRGRVTRRVVRRCRADTAAVLRELATVWHRECQVTRNMDTCRLAGHLYQEYLDRFPREQDAYRLRFYLAELLFALEQWRPAARAYGQVVAARPRRGKFLKDAAYARVIALKNANDAAPPGQLPARPAGNDLRPRPIPQGERELLDAFASYLEVVPRSPERVQILYREGRTYYSHNHFQQAIDRFARLVRQYPKHELAVYAANLLLDSLNILKRPDELQRWIVRLQRHPDLGQGELKPQLRKLMFQLQWQEAEAERAARRFRACGERYAKLSNSYQDNPRWAEMLYNAALCFEAAKMVGQAITIRDTLIKLKPDHPLAQKALYMVGQNFHALAWYSRAADYYETFARRFPGEPQAPEALQNAIIFRLGRGEHDKALENARLFEKSYGRRARYAARAAAVSFSLGSIYEGSGDAEATVRHYQRYLRRWGAKGGQDLQLRAHVKIAQALWDQACPIRGVDGACVRIQRERSRRTVGRRNRRRRAARTHCGPATKMRLTVHRRHPARVRAAEQHLRQALALYGRGARGGRGPRLPGLAGGQDKRTQRLMELGYAAAQARFLQAEALYEDFLDLEFPRKLELSSRDPRRAARAQQTLRAYLVNKDRKLQQARALYQQVIKMRTAHWSIAAAARIGQLFQTFADALFTAPIPKARVPAVIAQRGPRARREYVETYNDTYCGELEKVAFPLEDRAVQGLEACTSKSTELSWYNEWSRLCERELNQIKPGKSFLAAEIRAQPGYMTFAPSRAGVITTLEQ